MKKLDLFQFTIPFFAPVLVVNREGTLQFFNQPARTVFKLRARAKRETKSLFDIIHKETAFREKFDEFTSKATRVSDSYALTFEVEGEEVKVLAYFAKVPLPDTYIICLKELNPEYQLHKKYRKELDRKETLLREVRKLIRLRDKTIHEKTSELLKSHKTNIMSARLGALCEMAQGVAHEINNPLFIIMGTISYLERQFEKDDFQKEDFQQAVKRMNKAVFRITKITQSLLKFSRDASHDPKAEVDLEHIVSEALALCSERFLASGVKINFRPGQGDFIVYAREVEIGQAIYNLLNNAFEEIAHMASPWISIDISSDDSFQTLSITDSGSGVPDEIKEKIFEPFFSTRPQGTGTGLGLSVTKGILEEHGGQIEVLENEEGHTLFRLKIPSALGAQYKKSA